MIHNIDPSRFPSGLTMDEAGNLFGVSTSAVFEPSVLRSINDGARDLMP